MPHASAAINVLAIKYSLLHSPSVVTSANVIVGTPPQLSLAVGLPVLAGNVLSWISMVIFTGQVIVGGVWSNTVITWTHVAELPH